MSTYSSGEMAKACGVTVRTVQYYDRRNILKPSAFTDGGRRLYTESDLDKLRIICFLRSCGISLNVIEKILLEDNSNDVIMTLLDEEIQQTQHSISELQVNLNLLTSMRQSLSKLESVSVNSISDVAHIMQHKQELRRVRVTIGTVGLILGIFQWGTLIYGCFVHEWLPFICYVVVAIPSITALFNYYCSHVSFICPMCHQVFEPKKKEIFFAAHTATARKLTCTHCNHKGYCIEVFKSQE